MADLTLDPAGTALVLIDLQHSNVARQLAPHASQDVVRRGAALAEAVRAAGGAVVYVRVLVNELLSLPSDVSVGRDPSAPPLPPQASALVPEAGRQDGDLMISKRQWGAFHGTELDQLLRRRGVHTIILGGIATNFGVESTARAAADLGYALVFAEDAMSSVSAELHEFAVRRMFPILGKVRGTGQLLELLQRTV